MRGRLDSVTLAEHGAQLRHGALTEADLGEIEAALAGAGSDRAGVRLHGLPDLPALLQATAPIGRAAVAALGAGCFPVRALLFDKTAGTNWALGWHQDRTIAVRERKDVPGFGAWTRKQGIVHVAPPPSVLAGMITLRVHLDPVPASNAPLLIALGSHRLGMTAEKDIDRTVAAAERLGCLADRGDIWMYATSILHASAASAVPARRRVLQVDYAAAPLPGGLEWLGV